MQAPKFEQIPKPSAQPLQTLFDGGSDSEKNIELNACQKENTHLKIENENLTVRCDELTTENKQLTKEKTEALAENKKLRGIIGELHKSE